MDGFSRAVARVVAHPDEPPASAMRKVVLLLVSVMGMVGSALSLAAGLLLDVPYFAAIGCSTVPWCVLCGYLLYTKTVTDGFLKVFTGLALVGITMWDLGAMTIGFRGWGLFVVLIDALLVARAPRPLRVCVLLWVCGWFAFTSAEFHTRFGLMDLPGLPSYSSRVHNLMCDKPPCRVDMWWTLVSLVPLLVLLLDYKATAGFAEAVEAERAKMEQAVELSQTVAQCLAQFDLESAEAALQGAAGDAAAGGELHTAFARLVENLHSYRPYLPQSLVSPGSEDSAAEGSTTDEVSIETVTPERTPLHACNLHTPPCAITPRRWALPLPAVQRSLKRTQASLVLLTCDLAGEAAEPDIGACVSAHGAFLTEVLQTINVTGGILKHCNGEFVFASYNAFRRSVQHASHAVTGAAMHVRACARAQRPGAYATVVTGAVLAGNLGNETSAAPTILSGLSLSLEQMLVAARQLDERVVVSAQTYVNVSMTQPLRVLLHTFRLSGPGTQTGLLSHTDGVDRMHALFGGALFALLNVHEDHDKTTFEDDEWLYAMMNEPGTKWAPFNDAGELWHRDGPEAGLAYIRTASGVASDVLVAFQREAEQAKVFDFSLRVAAAEDQEAHRKCAGSASHLEDL